MLGGTLGAEALPDVLVGFVGASKGPVIFTDRSTDGKYGRVLSYNRRC